MEWRGKSSLTFLVYCLALRCFVPERGTLTIESISSTFMRLVSPWYEENWGWKWITLLLSLFTVLAIRAEQLFLYERSANYSSSQKKGPEHIDIERKANEHRSSPIQSALPMRRKPHLPASSKQGANQAQMEQNRMMNLSSSQELLHLKLKAVLISSRPTNLPSMVDLRAGVAGNTKKSKAVLPTPVKELTPDRDAHR
ncbi:hypothetical protein AgCh_022651 [Apium graveolens]